MLLLRTLFISMFDLCGSNTAKVVNPLSPPWTRNPHFPLGFNHCCHAMLVFQGVCHSHHKTHAKVPSQKKKTRCKLAHVGPDAVVFGTNVGSRSGAVDFDNIANGTPSYQYFPFFMFLRCVFERLATPKPRLLTRSVSFVRENVYFITLRKFSYLFEYFPEHVECLPKKF